MRHRTGLSRAAAAVATIAVWFNGFAWISYLSVTLLRPAIAEPLFTVKNPKFSGYTRDGLRHYELTANSAEEDAQGAGGLNLDQPRVWFETTNGSKLDVSAATGLLNKTYILTMRRDVVVAAGTSREIRLSEAVVDLRNSTVTSETPFEITSQTNTIRGNRLEVSESGNMVIVDGTISHSGNIIHFDRYVVQ
jgi:LPS export ABC transporter protein LptC